MIIVAARPAMGKSTLGLDFCRAAAIHHNLASVIFSLEMTRNEITMRLLSAEARIPLNHMRNGHMNDEDWTRLARKMGEVSSAPLFIDDSPNMTMMEIRAKARRLKQRHDLRLIVIDYLQLMTSGKKVESRQLEVSEFSRQIKLLAKELEVPVIALSQLNRGAEQRADKRPMMSDLRESGSIEQDADMVILLHREDVYEKESTARRRGRPDRGQAPQRPDPRHHRRLPGPLLPLRRHGPRLTHDRRAVGCRSRRRSVGRVRGLTPPAAGVDDQRGGDHEDDHVVVDGEGVPAAGVGRLPRGVVDPDACEGSEQRPPGGDVVHQPPARVSEARWSSCFMVLF